MNRKIIVILLLNTIPFLACCTLYMTGALLNWLFYMVFQLSLTLYNYRAMKRFVSFLMIQGVMSAASVIGLKVSNLLYYYHISPDAETLLVGNAGIWLGIIYIGTLTIIALVIRILNICYIRARASDE